MGSDVNRYQVDVWRDGNIISSFCLEVAAPLRLLEKVNVLGIQLLALIAKLTTCHAFRCLPAKSIYRISSIRRHS